MAYFVFFLSILYFAILKWFAILNSSAAGGYFGRYKMIKKALKLLQPWHIGTLQRVLSESYPIDTNIAGFRWFSKVCASLFLGREKP